MWRQDSFLDKTCIKLRLQFNGIINKIQWNKGFQKRAKNIRISHSGLHRQSKELQNLCKNGSFEEGLNLVTANRTPAATRKHPASRFQVYLLPKMSTEKASCHTKNACNICFLKEISLENKINLSTKSELFLTNLIYKYTCLLFLMRTTTQRLIKV